MNKYWGTKCTLDRLTHLFDDSIIYKYPERLEANGEPESQKNSPKPLVICFLQKNKCMFT